LPEDISTWNCICIVINLDIFNEITKANITNDVQSTKPTSTVFPGDRNFLQKLFSSNVVYNCKWFQRSHIYTWFIVLQNNFCEIYGNFVEFTEMENITCCTQKYRTNPALNISMDHYRISTIKCRPWQNKRNQLWSFRMQLCNTISSEHLLCILFFKEIYCNTILIKSVMLNLVIICVCNMLRRVWRYQRVNQIP